MSKKEFLVFSTSDIVALGLYLVAMQEQANGMGLIRWALNYPKKGEEVYHHEWCLPSGAKIFRNEYGNRKKGKWIGHQYWGREVGKTALDSDLGEYSKFGKIVRW